MITVRIVGAGRAGRSFARAWAQAGLRTELFDRSSPVRDAAQDVDAVLIATTDEAIREVAQIIEPGQAVVLHCSGATPLDAVAMHDRHGSIHPLMALPDPSIGAERLAAHGWFAVAGDQLATDLAVALGGRTFAVADGDRPLYHATAAVSANHLVALLGQVERLADLAGVPVEAFLDLARGSFDDVVTKGAAPALTGPAARGDHATIEAHLAALPDAERELYTVLAAAASRLAGRDPQQT